MRKLFLGLTALVMFVSLVTTTSLGTAYAATRSGAGPNHHQSVRPLTSPCYASGCNHLDPYVQGCQYGDATHGNAYRADSYYNNDYRGTFTIENWYSPRCNANWNVTTLYNGSHIIWVDITNARGVRDCYPSDCGPGGDVSASPIWTNMVDGSVTAQACVYARHPYNSVCGRSV